MLKIYSMFRCSMLKGSFLSYFECSDYNKGVICMMLGVNAAFFVKWNMNTP